MKKAMLLLMIIVLTLSYKVKASTYGYIYADNVQYGENGLNLQPAIYGNGFMNFQGSNSNNTLQRLWYFTFNQVNLPNNANSIQVNIRFRVNSTDNIETTTNIDQFKCNITSTEYSWYLGPNPDTGNGMYDHEYQNKSFTCQTHTETSSSEIHEKRYGIMLYYVSNGGITDYFPCYPLSNSGYLYSFTCPIINRNISGLRIVVDSNEAMTYSIGMSNLLNYETDTSQQIIDKQNEVISELNQTQEYKEDMNTNMTGVNETVEYSTQEQNLKSQLDLNTSMLDDLYIDSSTSGFIWDLVGGLRNMNPAIITLMSTMLGLGVIRLILNR